MRSALSAHTDRADPGRDRDRFTLSLWSQSPLDRVYRQLVLADDAFELAHRRVLALGAVVWLPLLVLTALEGHARNGVGVPFLLDVDVQARLLIALPLLIVGEVIVHRRVAETVQQFVERGIVTGAARTGFAAEADSATVLSRSVLAEVLILVCVYSIGFSIGGWWSVTADAGASWYGQSAQGRTLAGWWFALVSRPLFQFVLLRWYFKLLVWGRFLRQVSRLDLNLVPTHPDRRAGLGFLTDVTFAFAPFLCAHGTMLAGRIADGILYGGATLGQYQLELVMVPVAILSLVFGPVLAFAPRLWTAKRNGLLEYGALAERYVREFENKWLRGQRSASEELLGSADIQSLADLGSSLDIIERMRVVPVSRDVILFLCIVTLLPLAPLPLTVISGSELLHKLLKMVF